MAMKIKNAFSVRVTPRKSHRERLTRKDEG